MKSATIGAFLGASLLVAVIATGQTIKTDGDVEAQGFIGDGSGLENVDAADSNLLDGMDSTAFAAVSETYTKTEVDALITASGPKRFYLSPASLTNGSTATTACNSGFHMASKWELKNLDTLVYASDEVGAQGSEFDIGESLQPPVGGGAQGWAHNGNPPGNNVGDGPGRINCNSWTTTDGNGTALFLDDEGDVSNFDPYNYGWKQNNVPCGVQLGTWCIAD